MIMLLEEDTPIFLPLVGSQFTYIIGRLLLLNEKE